MKQIVTRAFERYHKQNTTKFLTEFTLFCFSRLNSECSRCTLYSSCRASNDCHGLLSVVVVARGEHTRYVRCTVYLKLGAASIARHLFSPGLPLFTWQQRYSSITFDTSRLGSTSLSRLTETSPKSPVRWILEWIYFHRCWLIGAFARDLHKSLDDSKLVYKVLNWYYLSLQTVTLGNSIRILEHKNHRSFFVFLFF